jgi:predicted aldo/keto reductase-like oxidoreductase
MRMWYKPYGKTGKQVSAISFGGMRFADPQDIDGSA